MLLHCLFGEPVVFLPPQRYCWECESHHPLSYLECHLEALFSQKEINNHQEIPKINAVVGLVHLLLLGLVLVVPPLLPSSLSSSSSLSSNNFDGFALTGMMKIVKRLSGARKLVRNPKKSPMLLLALPFPFSLSSMSICGVLNCAREVNFLT